MLKNKVDNCAFVKTILMLLVILDHSAAFWTGAWFTKNPVLSAEPLKLLSKWLGTVHTYGFVIVSGYLFYFAKYEQRKYEKFLPFIRTKAKRLLIPYCFVALFWVIPIQLLFFKFSPITVIKNYVLAMSPGQLWFLIMLFGVFAILWPLAEFCRKHTILSATMVLFLYSLGLIGSAWLPNVFMVWRITNYLPVFLLGFKMYQYEDLSIAKRAPWILVIIHTLFFVMLQACQARGTLRIVEKGVSFVLCTIGAYMSFAVLQKLANKVKWQNKWFGFVSARTMAVYLFHQQVIYFLVYWLNGQINPYLHTTINFVGTFVVSLALASLLMRFSATRRLIGEK